jgi:hypothetical protein
VANLRQCATAIRPRIVLLRELHRGCYLRLNFRCATVVIGARAMRCWQLTAEARRCESRERLGAPVRADSNRKFTELEMRQLLENIEWHPVLIANFRGLR